MGVVSQWGLVSVPIPAQNLVARIVHLLAHPLKQWSARMIHVLVSFLWCLKCSTEGTCNILIIKIFKSHHSAKVLWNQKIWNCIYYVAELVRAEKEHSGWLPEWSEFSYDTDHLRWNIRLKGHGPRIWLGP